MTRNRRLAFTICALLLALGVIPARRAVADVSPPVVVYRAEREAARPTIALCQEAWRQHGPSLARTILPATATADTVVCLVLDTDGFRRLAAGHLPDWGVGLAAPGGRAVALDYERLPQVRRGPQEVFLHEMAHALLFQAAGEVWLPTWFHEGVAMRASGQWQWTDTVAVVLGGHVPTLDAIRGPFPENHAAAETAYRASLLALNTLTREFGPDVPARIVQQAVRTGDFYDGFAAATGEDYDTFQRRFHSTMRLRYGWVLMLVRWPTLFVLMALLFVVGATRRLIRNRRRLQEMSLDEPGDPGG